MAESDPGATAADGVDLGARSPSEHVEHDLRARMASGELAPGKRLPSERALADRFGVTRAAVRSALLALEAEGLLEGSAGRTRRVVAAGTDAPSLLASTAVLLVDRAPLFQHQTLREPGWAFHIHRGVMEAAFQADLGILLLETRALTPERGRQVRRARPCGLIALDGRARGADGPPYPGIPCATYADHAPCPGWNEVVSDHEQGAHDLAAWLIQRGATRFLQVGGASVPQEDWYVRRRRGIERALAAAGLPQPVRIPVPGGADADYSERGFREGSRLLADRLQPHLPDDGAITAILADSDGTVPRVNGALRLLGRTPNTDVLVAGYDNYWRECPAVAWEPTPPLVTVDKDNRGIGAALVRLLCERRDGHLPPEPTRRCLPQQLVLLPAQAHQRPAP